MCGTYYRESDNKEDKSKYQIVKFDVENLPTYITDTYDDDWYDRFNGSWIGGKQFSSGIVPTEQFTDVTEFALTIGLLGSTNEEYCTMYGYKVVFDNLSLYDISYFAAANDWNGLLIGPDNIYWVGRGDGYRNNGDRTVHITAEKMIRE